ncbi:MAG: hypothetical protein HY526_08090 [Betaproteobacteria bacterium]|nr:hypothetical protein [Betaproteobacteria bacterium]
MSIPTAIEFARRKERLIARAARQRLVIGDAVGHWRKPIAVIDRGIAFARFLRSHPLLVAAGIAVAAALGRGRFMRWAGRGLFVWRAWRSLERWADRFGVQGRASDKMPAHATYRKAAR